MNVRRIKAIKVGNLIVLAVASFGLIHSTAGYSQELNPTRGPLNAYREFYMDRQYVVDPGQLASLTPGRIQFRLWTDFWQGRDCGASDWLNNCYLRVEIYDPRDAKCETPIYTKETTRITLRKSADRDASDNRPIDFDLGPFLAHPDPYRVRVYLMKGAESAPPIATPLSKKNWSMNQEWTVFVR